LVKIGKTTKETVEERGLNGSNVPEDFEIIFKYKVYQLDATEKSVHAVLDQFRYKSKSGRSTEFFYACAVEQAKKHLEPFQIEDVTLEPDNIEVAEDAIPYEVDKTVTDWISFEEIKMMYPSTSKFVCDPKAKMGWNNAVNYLRMVYIKSAKKEGKYDPITKRISKSFLEERGYLKKLLNIEWDNNKL
jgi:hypothetical protein